MAKKATFNLDGMAIVDGRLTGIVIEDTFSAQSKAGKGADANCTATWLLDLPMDVVIDKFWAGAKVSMRSARFSKMSIAEIEGVAGEQNIEDYLAAVGGTGRKKIAEVEAKLSEAQSTAMTQFYQLAMNDAVNELGIDAEPSSITGRTQVIFDERYAGIIKRMFS
jgi:hypothetical protein